MSYEFIDVEQGSQDWLNLRKRYITATDIGIIMGSNPYKTPYQLFKQKMDMEDPDQENDRMRLGKELEPIALERAKESWNCDKLMPCVVINPNYGFMASLDAFSSEDNILVEIKCGKGAFEALTKEDKIPEYYITQMQWQMYITGQNSCVYYCYWDDEVSHRIICRNELLIQEMHEKAIHFLECMDTFTPPELCDRDVQDRTGDEYLEKIMTSYNQQAQALKVIEDRMRVTKNMIIDYCKEKSTICSSGKITKIVTKGRINYKDVPELKDIDLEAYREKETISFRISSHE